ncbi:MAG: hypothetical protein KKF46_06655 [Nanoarchaeota archaeon]|nr:hypothetical protein [Nanoarchaeota archaeon]MBU1322010.1 hypothetical protein [Nanoarchaeota archaeon]MBU1598095.1 hypothetical protein [Nanoarchaeota archaeon]MBU2441776.1 hypothetical protein [Nanoarchaeota archaeon]
MIKQKEQSEERIELYANVRKRELADNNMLKLTVETRFDEHELLIDGGLNGLERSIQLGDVPVLEAEVIKRGDSYELVHLQIPNGDVLYKK